MGSGDPRFGLRVPVEPRSFTSQYVAHRLWDPPNIPPGVSALLARFEGIRRQEREADGSLSTSADIKTT
jgi:hypothetical protein